MIFLQGRNLLPNFLESELIESCHSIFETHAEDEFHDLVSRKERSNLLICARSGWHTYLAGVLVHYLKINQKPVQGGPLCSLVHPDDSQGAKRSELVVHNVREVQLCGEAAEKWGSKGYESWIELKTGRTHQVSYQSLYNKTTDRINAVSAKPHNTVLS